MDGVAELFRLLGDSTRLSLLRTLLEGDATVNELSVLLSTPQPRVSAHLGQLRKAGLVQVNADGRRRHYHVDVDRIQPLFDAILPLGEERKDQDDNRPRGAHVPNVAQQEDVRKGRIPPALRYARTCYGHLAGTAGVCVLEHFLDMGWLDERDKTAERQEFLLTAIGREELEKRSVRVDAAQRSSRVFAFDCADWTEHRGHLGGALGVALLNSLMEQNIARLDGGRTVTLDDHALQEWLKGGHDQVPGRRASCEEGR